MTTAECLPEWEAAIKWERWVDPFRGLGEWGDQEDDFEERKQLGPVIATPIGLFPVWHSALASRQFDMWVAHTNFEVTPLVQNIVRVSPGIEELSVLTRYRFRVGIARLFNSQEVRGRVADSLLRVFHTPTIVGHLKIGLMGMPAWAICKTRHGKIEVYTGATSKEVMAKFPEGVSTIECSWSAD